MAAVEIVKLLSQAEVVTDSQYVLDSVEKIATGIPSAQLQMLPNGDLLKELQERLQLPTADYKWTKVRSHQKILPDQPLRQQIHAIGNEAADTAAKHARKTLAENITYVTLHDAQERASLQKKQYEMMIALNRHRAKLEQEAHSENPHGADDNTEQILHVHIDEEHVFLPTNREDLLRWSVWGEGMAKALVTWLRGLKWPSSAFQDAESEAQDDPGISWVELLLDFQQVTQTIFPMNFASRQQPMKLRTPSQHEGCHQGDMTMLGMVRSFQAATKQIEKILQQQLLPVKRKVVRTLYQMGAGHQPIGLAYRPKLWTPMQVQTTLEKYYIDHPRAWVFDDILTYQAEQPRIQIDWTTADVNLQDEEQRLRRLQLKLRERRQE